MTRLGPVVICVLLICCLVPVRAADPMDDVPFDHWAYDACDLLVRLGLQVSAKQHSRHRLLSRPARLAPPDRRDLPESADRRGHPGHPDLRRNRPRS